MKFTYINQVDQRDCGAASLAMILGTFGRDVSIAEIRDLEKVSLDGATALGIKKAAESLGLETKAIQADMSLFNDYKSLPYPFIVHVLKPDNGTLLNHYYVVYKATKSHVYIADPDPTVKKRKMSYQAFSEHWTGVALFFAPTSNFQPKKDKKTSLTHFFPLIFKQKGLILNVVMAALLVTVISILGSYFIQLLIDEYIPNGLFTTLSLVSIGLIVAYIFQQIMSYTQKYLLLILGQRLSIDLILSYVKHLFKLPMNFFSHVVWERLPLVSMMQTQSLMQLLVLH